MIVKPIQVWFPCRSFQVVAAMPTYFSLGLPGAARHLGLVDRALVQAPAPLHDAAGLLFSPAVAVLLLEVDGDGGGYLGVVAGRDLGKTRKCPVAQLYRVPVQSLVKQVAGWEAPVEQLEEVVADLGLDTLAERWIEPENPAAARPLARSAFLVFNVFQILVVPSPLEGTSAGMFFRMCAGWLDSLCT